MPSSSLPEDQPEMTYAEWRRVLNGLLVTYGEKKYEVGSSLTLSDEQADEAVFAANVALLALNAHLEYIPRQPIKPLTMEQVERIIGGSGGYWKEHMFVLDAKDLINMVVAAKNFK